METINHVYSYTVSHVMNAQLHIICKFYSAMRTQHHRNFSKYMQIIIVLLSVRLLTM